MTKNTAIGSLEPDSSSKSGFSSPFNPSFFERSTEKTAAASVEEIMAPKSIASRLENPKTQRAKRPTAKAVKSTPKVESERAFLKVGFTSFQRVSSPPEKRIKAKARFPMARAAR
jgi:hypothetical protein